MSEVSAKSGQRVVITYPYDVPERMTKGLREIILTTEQAVDLHNQLGAALYG